MKLKFYFFLGILFMSTTVFASTARIAGPIETLYNATRDRMLRAVTRGPADEAMRMETHTNLETVNKTLAAYEHTPAHPRLQWASFYEKLCAALFFQNAAMLLPREHMSLFQESYALLTAVVAFFNDQVPKPKPILFDAYKHIFQCGEELKIKKQKKEGLEGMAENRTTDEDAEYLKNAQTADLERLQERSNRVESFSRVGPRTKELMRHNVHVSQEETRRTVAHVLEREPPLKIHSTILRLDERLRKMGRDDFEGFAELLLEHFDFLDPLVEKKHRQFEVKEDFIEALKAITNARPTAGNTYAQQLFMLFIITTEWERAASLLEAICVNTGTKNDGVIALKAYLHYLGDNNLELLVESLDTIEKKKSTKKKAQKAAIVAAALESSVSADKARGERDIAAASKPKTKPKEPVQIDPSYGVSAVPKARKGRKALSGASASDASDPRIETPLYADIGTSAGAGAGAGAAAGAGAGAAAGAGASADASLSSDEERDIPLPTRAANVLDEITSKSWKFTKKEFLNYVESRACTTRMSGGSHTVVNLPNDTVGMVLFENGSGAILTLPAWDGRHVPYYLRKQIETFQENLKDLEKISKSQRV